MHEIDPNDFKNKDADVVFEALLKQSQESFGYEMDIIENPIPLLTKYLYKWNTSKLTVNKRKEIASSKATATGDKAAKTLVELPDSGEGVQVKIENPVFATLTSKLNVLTSGKKALQQSVTIGLDLETDMEVACGKDAALVPKHAEIVKCMQALQNFMQQLRSVEAKSRSMTTSADPAKVKAQLDEVNDIIDQATAHAEGFKMMKARVVKFLEKK